ncbi:MAG: peptidoglycan-binding protein [Candidatus Omnitrophica bacterium]|nr:peptidoglycan-binding protein [Candidatus Omnitrophota bacterium]
MLKKFFTTFVSFAIVSSLYSPMPQAEAAIGIEPYVSARSLVVYDSAQSRILCGKNSNLRRPLASTTKVMTAMVVLDNMDLDDVITVHTETSYVPRTKIYVRPGERFRVRDLLKALLISSANDVAVVFAHEISGSERGFAALMNKKARRVGAYNTHYVNPHGLSSDAQYSTSLDLALIMNSAKKYPFIMQTLATKYAQIRSLRGRKFFLKNHNKMLWRDRRLVVGKTGFTRSAMHCFVGRINYRNRDVVVAIMGSVRPWHDLKVLLDYYSRVSFRNDYKEVRANKKAWDRRKIFEFEKALKRAGYKTGRVDGVVTTQTVSAIRGFQKRYHLETTGVIGPLTAKQLKKFT